MGWNRHLMGGGGGGGGLGLNCAQMAPRLKQTLATVA